MGGPGPVVVFFAGSFAAAECIRCKRAYTKEGIRPQIMRGEVVYCEEKRCKGREDALVSPRNLSSGTSARNPEKGVGPLTKCPLFITSFLLRMRR